MKNEFPFSKDELKQAAEIVNKAMLQAVPEPEECKANFSPEFDTKMSRIFTKDKRRQRTKRFVRSVCAAAASFVLIVGIWLASDVEARAAVLNWVRETYQSGILYKFFGDSSEQELPLYTLGWLPDGFVEVSCYSDNTRKSFFYKNEKTNETLCFEYLLIDSGTQTLYLHADEPEKIDINGIPGDFYSANEKSDLNNLIWIDENKQLVFFIDSTLGKSEIINIACNIKLVNT